MKKNFLENMNFLFNNIIISFNNPLFKRYIAVISILIWVFCTITSTYMHCYNTDELWAWDIASDLNFIDIIKLMHYEGHTFLWYIILKPFTHFNIFFPYAIKFVNWIFAFITIILLWRLAPFNNVLKILITFSHPFLIIYPTLGRGYSLSILLLFLLTILYQKRLEKPVLYSLILFFAINSDIITFLCSSGFAIYFIYDYLKQEQNNNQLKKWLPVLIIVLGWIFILLQWLPFYSPNYVNDTNRTEYLEKFFFTNKDFLNNCISFIIFFPFAQFVFFKVTCCIKNKRFILFSILLFNLMFAFFYFVYAGRNYHLYYFYIYLIIFYWVILNNSKEIFDNKFVYYLLLTFMISISLIFMPINRPDEDWSLNKIVFDADADYIKAIVPKGSVIYMAIDLSQGLIPYLKNDYILKTLNGNKIPSYEAYKGIYQEPYKGIDEIIHPEKNSYYVIATKYTKQYRHRINFIIPDQYTSFANNSIYYIFKLDKNTIETVRKMKRGEYDN